MGIKDRRTKILISLLLSSDVNLSPVNIDFKIQKIFDISFNQKTRGTISGLIKEGFVEKVDSVIAKESQKEPTSSSSTPRDDKSTYKITEAGFMEFSLKFPFFRYLKNKWDGRLRILSYEIPEKKRELRDKLRREVEGWGLGPWHRSFWLTPHPIVEPLKQLVSQKEEEQYVQAFESDHVFGNKEILIEKVWQKSLLDKNYRNLFKKWHEILSKEEDKIVKLKKVVDNYIDILRQDPGLPAELVGEKWIGFEAYNIFKEIRGILLS